jgi:Tat protein secretion system quality control protein TatD with DNase activity
LQCDLRRDRQAHPQSAHCFCGPEQDLTRIVEEGISISLPVFVSATNLASLCSLEADEI